MAASVLSAKCREVKQQRTSEMNTQGPISQANHVAAALDETKKIVAPASLLRGDAKEATAFSNRKGERVDVTTPHFTCPDSGCADTMHELANSMTAVLINAQVLEWKLPPYSRLKRPVREIERHAQRSGELLKRLLHEFEPSLSPKAGQEFCGQVPTLHGTMAAVTAQGLGATDGGPVKLPLQMRSPSASAPGFSPERELTLICDPCTSTSFPNEER